MFYGKQIFNSNFLKSLRAYYTFFSVKLNEYFRLIFLETFSSHKAKQFVASHTLLKCMNELISNIIQTYICAIPCKDLPRKDNITRSLVRKNHDLIDVPTASVKVRLG